MLEDIQISLKRFSVEPVNEGRPVASKTKAFFLMSVPRTAMNTNTSCLYLFIKRFPVLRVSLSWEDGRAIMAKIPRGVQTGSRVRLKDQGEPGVHGGVPGDFFLIIEVLPDSRFLRKGDDLETTMSVDLFTLLLGGIVTVAGIDRSVRLDLPAETPNGRIFRLKGLGMPVLKNPEKRGNLYVTVEAELPKHPIAEEKDLIQQWKKLR